nr:proline-rich protein 2-like [Pan troglodytes]
METLEELWQHRTQLPPERGALSHPSTWVTSQCDGQSFQTLRPTSHAPRERVGRSFRRPRPAADPVERRVKPPDASHSSLARSRCGEGGGACTRPAPPRPARPAPRGEEEEPPRRGPHCSVSVRAGGRAPGAAWPRPPSGRRSAAGRGRSPMQPRARHAVRGPRLRRPPRAGGPGDGGAMRALP